jgi:D-arabinose 1-dehydrogenase-like Zn-dependent alcohol dehydrogenase
MKAVVFPGERKVQFLDFPDPTPGPGEVVLEIKASGMRVMQHHYRGCGVCEHCSTGWMQLCVEGVKEVYGATGHGARTRAT